MNLIGFHSVYMHPGSQVRICIVPAVAGDLSLSLKILLVLDRRDIFHRVSEGGVLAGKPFLSQVTFP